MFAEIRRTRSVAPLLLVALLAIAQGCSSSDTAKKDPAAPAKSDPAKSDPSKPGGADKPVAPKVADKPDPAKVWAGLASEAKKHIGDKAVSEARKSLDALAKVYVEPAKPSDAQTAELADLESQLAAEVAAQSEKQRAEKLVEAEKLMDLGKFEDATKAVDLVRTLVPTDEQRAAATAIATEIERRRSARRQLITMTDLLGSTQRQEVRSAQTMLAEDPGTALPLLLEAVERTDNATLVVNAMETLRRMNRPDITLPALVTVLGRAEQKKNWPDAVKEIGRMNAPGAGEPLLDLVLNSKDAEQRQAALQALAAVVDTPTRTTIALLPAINEDGPELAQTIQAVYRAVEVHQLHDLLAHRALDVDLTPSDEELLAALPARLAQIISAGSVSNAEAANAAKVLAVALRQIAPEPLTGVKVSSVGSEAADGPAAAILDGVWNSVDLTTMWRYPATDRGSIVLDLGDERTVTGVRIWNFNEAAGGHRGWKEVEVFVSNNPRELTAVAAGIVPAAAGVADTPDYSAIVPVNFARGRYVRLQAKSLWRPDVHAGLSEVQIIGF